MRSEMEEGGQSAVEWVSPAWLLGASVARPLVLAILDSALQRSPTCRWQRLQGDADDPR